MFQREHEVLLRNVVLFMGHVVRSVVQRPMQNNEQEHTLDSCGLSNEVVGTVRT